MGSRATRLHSTNVGAPGAPSPLPAKRRADAPAEGAAWSRLLPPAQSTVAHARSDVEIWRDSKRDAAAPDVFAVHPLTRVQRGLYLALFAATAALAATFYYLVSEDDETRPSAGMRLLVSHLRSLRAAARTELLATATENGEVPMSRSHVLRWWATGPRDADVVVLLVADDGETAAFWGGVHAALARKVAASHALRGTVTAGADVAPTSPPSVRIVSFHRACTAVDGSTLLSHGRPLTLRLADISAILDAASCNAATAAAPDAAPRLQKWAWLSPGGASGGDNVAQRLPLQKRVVVVSHGEGVWAALAYAGSSPADVTGSCRAATAAIPTRRAAVLVSPMFLHRGRFTAWLDAVAAASRSQPTAASASEGKQRDPLATGLKAPPASNDLAATDPAGAARLRLQAALPSRSNVDTMRTTAFINPEATATAAREREAEISRGWRARQPVLTASEQRLVTQAVASGLPPVSVIIPAQASLPPFVPAIRRAAAELWHLQAAAAVAAMYGTESAAQTTGTDVDGAQPASTSAEAVAHVAAPAPMAYPEAADVRTAVAAAATRAVASLADWEAKSPSDAVAQRGLREMPLALGWMPPQSLRDLKGFRGVETTLRTAPHDLFSLSRAGVDEGHGDGGALRSELARIGYEAALASLPLQAPNAVADAVWTAMTRS